MSLWPQYLVLFWIITTSMCKLVASGMPRHGTYSPARTLLFAFCVLATLHAGGFWSPLIETPAP